MISSVHVTLFTPDADAARAFFRDVLELRSVDAGGGWLIFAVPQAELAMHPTDGDPRHELFLMCDDLEETLRRLKERGIESVAPLSDEGWGRLTRIDVPGLGHMGIYEPSHPTPHGHA